MKTKYKVVLTLFVILMLFIICLLTFKVFTRKKDIEPIIKVVDTIDNFSYSLDERDTDIMKEVYGNLKTTLTADQVDFKEYAKNLASLFVIDLFTIENKVNKYDVGGLEYIYPDAKDNFKTNVIDTLYKGLKNNSDGKRTQELPVVTSVEILEVKEDKFKIKTDEYDSYIIMINWDYEEYLGYDNSATITIIKNKDMLYVVSYVPGDKHE